LVADKIEETLMKIWANCIVHNEENFIWFALMSVLDYVDKILVWDTGSTDKTVEIIKEIIKAKPNKIEFKEVGLVDKSEFTKMRQKMLEESKCDWILILDGDEVWWRESIGKLVGLINKEKTIDAIVSPFYNCVGDIYHFQSQEAGKYEIAGKKGHITIRALNRNIPGLRLTGPYGEEAYVDANGRPIQQSERIVYLDAPFMHLTHLKRSLKKGLRKYKYDLGLMLNKGFPEVFYLDRPSIVPPPWIKRSKLYEVLSLTKKVIKND
jgi:glycosyltransferase involved in cell wall biosynthesis